MSTLLSLAASHSSLAFAPPAYPKAPFEDCGSSALKPEAAYYKQLNATNCINGYDATPLRTITNATQTIEVYYKGMKVYNDSFDVCAKHGFDGIPECPWTPETPLHVIDVNPVHPPAGPYTGRFIFTDSNGEQLFCLSTNWTFNLLA